jgi:integrase
MGIYKRGETYWYKFMFNGELVRKSTKQGSDKVARRIEAAHRTRLADGLVGIREKKIVMTLADFLSDRIEPWAKKQKRSSWLWYRSGIRPASRDEIAKVKLNEITGETIAEYASRRQEEGLKVGSVNRELRVLRRILRLAVEWKLIESAPKVRMAGNEHRRDRVVSDVEFARYATCASPLLADVATVLGETGLRPDECHRLDWSDITFVNGRHGNLRVRHGKTVAARRQLPLTARVRAILEARWNDARRPEEGWVWPADTKTGHIDHSTLKKQHRNALRLSGVRPFVLYSLRHTFATRIAPRVDAWTLCKIMGWSSLSVAMTYIHPSDQRVLDAFSTAGDLGRHKIGHSSNLGELTATGEITEGPVS